MPIIIENLVFFANPKRVFHARKCFWEEPLIMQLSEREYVTLQRRRRVAATFSFSTLAA